MPEYSGWGSALSSLGKSLMEMPDFEERARKKKAEELADKLALDKAQLDFEAATEQRGVDKAALEGIGNLSKTLELAAKPEGTFVGPPTQDVGMDQAIANFAKYQEAKPVADMPVQEQYRKFNVLPSSTYGKPLWEQAEKDEARRESAAERRYLQDQNLTAQSERQRQHDELMAALSREKVAAGKEKEKSKELDAVSKAKAERASIISTIDEVMSDPALATGFNPLRLTQAIPGTRGYDFAQKVQNIKNRLALNERGKLKGQGQVSDKESEMLNKAVSILSTGLSKDAFLKELQRLRSTIQGMDDTDGGSGSGYQIIDGVKVYND